MKTKHYIFILLSLSVLYSCSKKSLSVGESVTRKIEISFENSNSEDDWHLFSLNKTEGLDVSFSKGKVTGNQYRISAKEYNVDSKPVIVTLSANAAGKYSFELVYSQSSNSIEVDFANGNSLKIPELTVQGKWTKYIGYIIAAFLLAVILAVLWIIKIKRDNSFDFGYIQVTTPKDMQIDLEGKSRINIIKELKMETDCSCNLYCEKDETDTKVPRIEIDDSISRMEVNGISAIDALLKNRDKVAVYDNAGQLIIFLQYEE
jgi:hypothetical protein